MLTPILMQTSGSTLSIASTDTSGMFAVSGNSLAAGPNYSRAYPMQYVAEVTETPADASSLPKTTSINVFVTSPNNFSVPIFGNGPNAAMLTFDDEFNGTSLDTTKWSQLVTSANRGWPKTDFEQSANTVSGGFLNQTVSAGGTGGKPYTGGFVYTSTAFTQSYGYWEVRMKMGSGAPGAWVAFWLNKLGSFPEIDILEWLGNATTVQNESVHPNPDVNGGAGFSATSSASGSPDASSAFHVYGMFWASDYIAFWIDGAEVLRFTAGQVIGRTSVTIPSDAMQIVLDNACGGFKGNACGATTTLPFVARTDYVHVYLPGGTTAVTPQTGYGGPGDAVGSGS